MWSRSLAIAILNHKPYTHLRMFIAPRLSQERHTLHQREVFYSLLTWRSWRLIFFPNQIGLLYPGILLSDTASEYSSWAILIFVNKRQFRTF